MKYHLIVAGLAIGILGAACSSDSGHHATGGARTENVDMTDNAFSLMSLKVAKGETVNFHFSNKGKLVHEAIIGDEATQEEHAAEMSASSGSDRSGMEHGGGHEDGANAISIEPGKSGDLTYTFGEAGTVIVGCHEPGHYESGMRITVTVA